MQAQKNHSRPEIAAPAPPEWSSLLTRVIDDGARVLRGEAALLKLAVLEHIERQIGRLLLDLLFVLIALCGFISILIGAVFLVHRWLPWWIAFGSLGAIEMTIAALAYYALSLASRRHSGRP